MRDLPAILPLVTLLIVIALGVAFHRSSFVAVLGAVVFTIALVSSR